MLHCLLTPMELKEYSEMTEEQRKELVEAMETLIEEYRNRPKGEKI